MPRRRMLVLTGALTAALAVAAPLKLAIDADGRLHLADQSASAASENGGGNDSAGGNSGNGNSASGNGNGSENGNAGGNGNGNGADKGDKGSESADSDSGSAAGEGKDAGNGTGNGKDAAEPDADTDDGAGTAAGSPASPGTATGSAAKPGAAAPSATKPGATPALSSPAAPSKPADEVNMRGTSITVRHSNGATERISQGRYEMRDSRSRTIVNRTATPADASRLKSFGK